MAFNLVLLPVGRYVTMHGSPDRWQPALLGERIDWIRHPVLVEILWPQR